VLPSALMGAFTGRVHGARLTSMPSPMRRSRAAVRVQLELATRTFRLRREDSLAAGLRGSPGPRRTH